MGANPEPRRVCIVDATWQNSSGAILSSAKNDRVCFMITRGARVRGKYLIGVLMLPAHIRFRIKKIILSQTHASQWLQSTFRARRTRTVSVYTESANRPGTPGKITW